MVAYCAEALILCPL